MIFICEEYEISNIPARIFLILKKIPSLKISFDISYHHPLLPL